MTTKCSRCHQEIENISLRLFIDSKKKQQVCSKCWEKACEEKFQISKNPLKIIIKKITSNFQNIYKHKEGTK
jgi:hypothetical protein